MELWREFDRVDIKIIEDLIEYIASPDIPSCCVVLNNRTRALFDAFFQKVT